MSSPQAVRVLVTGLSGFVGCHIQGMADQLRREYNAEILPVDPLIDLRHKGAVDRLVSDSYADWVIHLAAQSNVPAAFKDPEETLQVNVIGTLHLLQALERAKFLGRVLYVSSGDVYGFTPEELLPISEAQLPKPGNPYAVSKLAAEALCLQWGMASSFEVVVARPFNHIGAGQRPEFVIASIARQIVEAAQDAEISVGDIDVTRDFLDVRDVIEAYFALLSRGQPGVIYNVCSGQEHRIRDLAQEMAQLAGKQIVLTPDPDRFRAVDQRRVCGSNERIRQDTGWEPRRSLSQTLQEML